MKKDFNEKTVKSLLSLDWGKPYISGQDPQDMIMEVFYNLKESLFKVEVSLGQHKEVDFFQASYAPRFGMDVDDVNQAYEVAEILAKKIEKASLAHSKKLNTNKPKK